MMKTTASSILGLVALTMLATGTYATPATRATTSRTLNRSTVVSNTSDASVDSHSHFVVVQVWVDLKYLAGQQDFLLIVGGLGLTPAVFDEGFESESARFSPPWDKSQLSDDLLDAGSVIGDGRTPVAASIAAWSIGSIGHMSKLRDFGSDLFRAQAINGLFTGALKFGINRKRPNGGSYSYPSGHTSSAFTTAGVVYRHFGKEWGIPAFLVAGYVGVSRLRENKHYATDVVAGAILGSAVSLKLANRQKRHHELSLVPAAVHGTNGLALVYRFR